MLEPELLKSLSNLQSKKTMSNKIGLIGRLPGDDDVIQM